MHSPLGSPEEGSPVDTLILFYFSSKNICLFIWLHWVLVVALKIFVASQGMFCYGAQIF